MKKTNTINRRSFVKISAMASGGMVLGFSWLASCKKSELVEIIPELQDLPQPDQWQTVNGYIKIGNNNVVTIYSANPEIGQNVKTSMPMIVADELDVDWRNVIVEQAPLDSEKYERQVAGGSQSIRSSWDNLRKAGATAKYMLVTAAAQQWGVETSTCSVANGVITNANGESLTYGEVAEAAATIEVPESIPLKEKSNFTIIGKDKKNVDIKKIIKGEPIFGIDHKVEGMMYASVLRPPAFGQTLVDYDDQDARAVSGVKEVIKFGDKIAVLAENNWAAIKGKQALKAEWKNGEILEDTNYHDTELKKLLDQKDGESRRNDGDVEQAFAEADEILERIYESPFLPHNCLEPMNFFAHVTGDKAVCSGPIQTPAWTQNRIATLLEIDPKNVSIMMSRMGGGFGRRLYGDFALEAAEISKISGYPVQLQFTREDDMAAGTYRPSIKYKIKASIKNGKVSGYQLTEAAINSNMYGLIPNFFPAWAIENFQVNTYKVDSNITTGAWRAPYTNFLAFAEQSFFDELAELINVDPIALRIELLENAKKHVEDERMEWSPERMQGVIRMAAEKSGYGQQKEGVFQGISAYYSHNTHVAEVADIVLQDGIPVVQKITCAVDCGIVINPIAARNQVEGGIIDGLGHAMFGDFSFENGKPTAYNFDKFRLIRQNEVPEIDIHFIENDLDPTGLGEPSLPPVGGAVANAMYKATGKRFYQQPFIKYEEVLG